MWVDEQYDAKVLPKEKCAELYRICVKNFGNKNKEYEEAFTKLWHSTVLIALKLAFRYKNNVLSLEDLVAEGFFAFVKAIESGRYNLQKGAWSTWITNRIKSRILYILREEFYVVRLPHYQFGKLEHNVEYLPPTFDIPSQDENEENEDLRIDGGGVDYSVLSSREAYVLKSMFFENQTLKEIGSALNVTKERIRQIKVQALEKLRVAV